jgi:hypothetical protein
MGLLYGGPSVAAPLCPRPPAGTEPRPYILSRYPTLYGGPSVAALSVAARTMGLLYGGPSVAARHIEELCLLIGWGAECPDLPQPGRVERAERQRV